MLILVTSSPSCERSSESRAVGVMRMHPPFSQQSTPASHSTMSMEPEYTLGYSPADVRHLMAHIKADILRPATERLLRSAGRNATP
jgi:hypothetical protein